MLVIVNESADYHQLMSKTIISITIVVDPYSVAVEVFGFVKLNVYILTLQCEELYDTIMWISED